MLVLLPYYIISSVKCRGNYWFLSANKDGLSEKDYEELFLKQIVGTYSTLIASELVQMYIRHGLQNGKISPKTGEHQNVTVSAVQAP